MVNCNSDSTTLLGQQLALLARSVFCVFEILGRAAVCGDSQLDFRETTVT